MSDKETEEYDKNEVSEENTMKILLATDCHLGYEHNTKRLQENDSFVTFEEILQHAQKNEVDFVLLGGDLFHDSKPPQKIVLQCIELLKQYCLGDRDVKIQFLSDPEIIFPHAKSKMVNYEDPNLNVGLPVFSIHGNHDNPSFESTGSLDLLMASGLINYFGKWSDLTQVSIPPLIFKKGETYVSLYGLSYICEQRLSRLLRDEKFNLYYSKEIPTPFSIFVLHQNRARHSANAFIPENALPEFLDLVFWGHEHECRLSPEYVREKKYYISQPGSSVATSLCEGEAVPKHIGLLKIHKNQFKIEKIKLNTVRPFVFDNLNLRSLDIKPDFTKPLSDVIYEFVDDYIESVLIPKANEQLTGNPKQPTIPLIRLRIFYSEETELFDAMRVARKYCDKVANSRDMIVFRKERLASDSSKYKIFKDEDDNDNDFYEMFRNEEDVDWNCTVEGTIQKYFDRGEKKNQMTVLSVAGLNEALKRFVEAGDDEAFHDVIEHQLKKNQEYMKDHDCEEEEEIIEQLKAFRDQRINAENAEDEEKDVQDLLNNASRRDRMKRGHTASTSMLRDESDDDEIYGDIFEKAEPTRGRGRGSRARGKAKAPTRARGRATPRGRGAAAARASQSVNVSCSAPRASSSRQAAKNDSDEGNIFVGDSDD